MASPPAFLKFCSPLTGLLRENGICLRFLQELCRKIVGPALALTSRYSQSDPFLSYVEFDSTLLPKLRLRTKVSLRTQRVEVLDPDDDQLLYFKERYIDPADPEYPRLREIFESLMKLGVPNSGFLGPTANELCRILGAEGRNLTEALGLNLREERGHGGDRA